ncbi:hypothetical protein PAXINDRAFT_87505, partial [Paxillus involutus ATCC 200175]
MSLPKGSAHKLVPKFIGSCKLIRDIGNNSYHVGLLDWLRQRGIHPVFHASLLQIHIPNNDQLFPGWLETQVTNFGKAERQWSVDKILSHQGTGTTSLFEIRWTSGNVTWLPYEQVSHLDALAEYLSLLGI